MKRHPRPRILLKLGVFLLLGVIVNVAVAWGSVIGLAPLHNHHTYAANEREMTSQEAVDLLHRILPDVRELPDHAYGVTQSRFGWTSFHTGTDTGDQPNTKYVGFDVNLTTAGWPIRSVLGYSEWDGRRPDDTAWRYVWAITVPEWAKPENGNRRLIDFVPYCPIWPGFAINTIFYAALLWVLWMVPGKIRRLVRIRRGRCPACGYPVGTSVVCTECGNPVRARSVQSP